MREPTGLEHDHVVYWSWVDAHNGIVRARAFDSLMGIAEDEATGSAALLLAVQLGRAIEIWQGNGSLLYARPVADGVGEVGGRVALVETRDHAG
jgi:predicted PhzF superfamily epimerase YddE/YHI9